MTAPSLRALGAVLSSSTAAPSFAAPAGAVSTDVILVGFFADDGRKTVTGVPTGFTIGSDLPQVNDPAAGSPSHGLYVYWGRFSDVGAGPYGFTLSGAVFIEGRTAAIQGCITSGSPLEAADGNTTGNTSATTAPAVSATSTGADRYAFYAASNWSGGAWTPAGGYTEQWDANDEVITFDDLAMPTAATTSPQAVCAGNNRSNAWVGIFIPPASGGSVSADAALTVTASFSASMSGTTTPAAALAVTASLSTAAARTALAGAALSVTATLAAAADRTAAAAASLAVTATLAAGAVFTKPVAAALAITASLSAATGGGTSTAGAALSVTASLTAAASTFGAGGPSAPGPTIRTVARDRTLRFAVRGG